MYTGWEFDEFSGGVGEVVQDQQKTFIKSKKGKIVRAIKNQLKIVIKIPAVIT
ncbi:MAG: hypothetical protein F6K42_39185 [Leptolyngbya sp. SIO1D8]|nr:hypothetical protein [Leptolyngbya sp. SIO1D8]